MFSEPCCTFGRQLSSSNAPSLLCLHYVKTSGSGTQASAFSESPQGLLLCTWIENHAGREDATETPRQEKTPGREDSRERREFLGSLAPQERRLVEG